MQHDLTATGLVDALVELEEIPLQEALYLVVYHNASYKTAVLVQTEHSPFQESKDAPLLYLTDVPLISFAFSISIIYFLSNSFLQFQKF